MERIIRIIFDQFLTRLLQLLGLMLIMAILIQIYSRFIMLRPFSWTEELARFSFLWFCLLGSAYTLRKDMHLGIDYYYLKFNPSARKIIDIFVTGLILFFGVLLIVLGMRMVVLTMGARSPIMRLPMSYMYAVLPATGFLFTIFSAHKIIELLKGSEMVRKRRKSP